MHAPPDPLRPELARLVEASLLARALDDWPVAGELVAAAARRGVVSPAQAAGLSALLGASSAPAHA